MGEGSSDADSRMIFFSVGFETLCPQVFFGFDFNGNDLFAVVYQQINFAVVPVIGVIVKAVVIAGFIIPQTSKNTTNILFCITKNETKYYLLITKNTANIVGLFRL